MVFEKLHPKVQELVERRNWSGPTAPQVNGIPPILSGQNVLIIAPTGVGKTESSALPLFSKWLEKKPKPISILYITPLRALNRDLFNRLLWWSEKLDLDLAVRHGDTSDYEREKQAQFPPDMLITTPETLQAILPGKRLREHLKNVRWLIVDEVHELCESKRGIQLSVGLERLRELAGDFQRIGLSATVGSPELVAKFLGGNQEVKVIEAFSPKELKLLVRSPIPRKKESESGLSPELFAQIRSIAKLIESHRSTLIFTNTREAAEILSARLHLLDNPFDHGTHHSSLSKEVRVEAEDKFKKEKLKALLATSSLELGIDIGSIDQIGQYQSPRQVCRLVQRVGRGGHKVGQPSKGCIVSTTQDDLIEAAIIARRATKGELEANRPPQGCLDVLANQLVGLALDEYGIKKEKAYKIIIRSWPYQKLDKSTLDELLQFLKESRLLWLDDQQIKRSNKSWKYYYQNLSTIPDTKSYEVVDSIEQQSIGQLDEAFVAEHCKPGLHFIMRGSPWKVTGIEDKVWAEPSQSPELAIPAWEGELIPVPLRVAKESSELKEKVAKLCNKKEKARKWLLERYPIEKDAANQIVKWIEKQLKKGKICGPNKLVIEAGREAGRDFVIIHSPYGSRVNETLEKYLAARLTKHYGRSVRAKSDPYRLILEGASMKEVKRFLEEGSNRLESRLLCSLRRSKLFRWRFLHVAKRFGILRKDATWGKINLKRVIKAHRRTPVFQETLNEVLHQRLDLDEAISILKKIQEGKIEIETQQGISPHGRAGLEYQFRELVGPKRPEREIFKAFKERLLKTRFRLYCMHCYRYIGSYRVKNLPSLRCKCGSGLITAIKPWESELQKLIRKARKRKLKSLEEDKLEQPEWIADLVLTYGKKFLICLAGRGIGPETAIRILAKQPPSKERLYKEILEAERQFARTKRFWRG